jgi:hypothetical protein
VSLIKNGVLMVGSGKEVRIAGSSREEAYERKLEILESSYEMQKLALEQRHQKRIDDLKKNNGIK